MVGTESSWDYIVSSYYNYYWQGVVIVLTDGESNVNHAQTIPVAQTLHAAGLDVSKATISGTSLQQLFFVFLFSYFFNSNFFYVYLQNKTRLVFCLFVW